MDQDIDVFVDALHAVWIGDKIGREVAPVKLHALNDIERGLQALSLFDGNHALFANLVHRLGDDLADGRIIVG